IVPTHYPAPIALAYQRFLGQGGGEPRAQVERLFKAMQATLRYLTFLGLADLFRSLARAGAPLPEDEAFNFLRRPTQPSLGHWARALTQPCGALAARPDVLLPELAEAGRRGGRLQAQLFDWLVRRRNLAEHTGGDLALSAGEGARLLAEARPLLEAAF